MLKSAAITLFAISLTAPALAGGLAGGPLAFEQVPADLCVRITTLAPSGEADYKPGVTVHGRPVASAEADGSLYFPPPPVLVFKARVAPFPNAADRYNRSYIDTVEVEIDTKTGRLRVDGQEIDGTAHALAEACARQKPH